MCASSTLTSALVVAGHDVQGLEALGLDVPVLRAADDAAGALQETGARHV